MGSGPPRALVLLYHRVADVTADPWGLAVTPARFAEQIEMLAEEFSPLRLAELVAGSDGGRESPRVALTFDDGYRDNLEVAAPLLARHGVPATVFVVSGYVGTHPVFWWDELAALCPPERYRELHGELYVLASAEREARLDELRGAAARPSPGEPTTMTADELRRLAAHDEVEVGAHTVTHPVLPGLDRGQQLDELRSSRVALEDILGKPVPGVSYPYGSHTAETIECAVEAGFAYACTSVREPVTGSTRPFAIPRCPVRDWSGGELASRIRAWLAAG